MAPKSKSKAAKPTSPRRESLTKDKNNDGRVTRSEGEACPIGDLNSDGRVTRSEARAARHAGVPVVYDSLK